MATSPRDPAKDIVTADPFEVLQKASKINLGGGGVLLFAVIVAVYVMNVAPKWQINGTLILVALIGSVLLALAAVAVRMFDVHTRARLTLAKLANEAQEAEEASAEEKPEEDTPPAAPTVVRHVIKLELPKDS